MSNPAVLRGIAWNHSRALPPLVATAQRYEELHPAVEIRWEKRTLHEFGHVRLTPLARDYDLLIVDHPMMGEAYATRTLIDLADLVPVPASVGPSFESYRYEGTLFAVPVDAAAPGASYSAGLFASANGLPRLWPDVLDLARDGKVVMPGFHADLFLNLVAFCVSRGSPVAEGDELFKEEIALRSLEDLGELASYIPPAIFDWNPIGLYEELSSGAVSAYCPFAYTYSNYSREGFAARHILFDNPVDLEPGVPLRTVLGGTGIAISTRCPAIDIAIDYARYVASAECQRTLYGLSGGQPACREAWVDDTLNAVTRNFFRRTLASLDHAYVRPRYNGYIELQAGAGLPIQKYLREGGSARAVLDEMNRLYRKSRR